MMISENPLRAALLFPLVLFGSGAAAQEERWTQEKLEEVTQEIRREIEEIRGVDFPRDVSVAIASKEDFRAYLARQLERMTTPEELAAQEEVAKLLGLIPPDMDLLLATERLLEAQVGGFYDPEQERFYLMERFGGDLARIILAHELTHALDDQLFDLDGTLESLDGNTDAQLAFHAVAEGSGVEAMNVYTFRHLSELDLDALAEASTIGLDAAADLPPYVWKPLLASYLGGSAFLSRADNPIMAAMRQADWADVRAAFQRPPRSSEQILHPEKYWEAAERDEPVPVRFETSDLPEGWRVVYEDTLGELGFGLLVEPLEERRGLTVESLAATRMTYPASEGWGGDRFVLLGRDGARVLVVHSAWDAADEARELREALDALADHLDEAARTLDPDAAGSGVLVLAGEDPREVVVHAWTGVAEAERERVLAALRVEADLPPPPAPDGPAGPDGGEGASAGDSR